MMLEGIVILAAIGVVYWKVTSLRPYMLGIGLGIIILLILLIYKLWEGNYLDEYQITIPTIKYRLKELYNREGKNNNKYIHRMTQNDIQTFFKNHSNSVKHNMEFHIKQGYDIVSYADVVEFDQIFSLVILACRDKDGHYDYLNWKIPNQLIYMINPCMITQKEKKIEIMKHLFPDRDDFVTIADTPAPNIHDLIILSYTTIVPSEKKKDHFKIRNVYFHPVYNYQAIAVKMMFEKYYPNNLNKVCFFS